MFDTIPNQIVSALTSVSINALRSFPTQSIDKSKAIVCVCLKSADITASGCGNYIGLCTENGTVKEMYGSKAAISIGLDIYSPGANCDLIKDGIIGVLSNISSMTLKSFAVSETEYDKQSGMFLTACTARAGCLLVRQLSSPEWSLEDDDE